MSAIYRLFTLKSLFRRRKEWITRIFICSFTVTTFLIFPVVYSSTQYAQYKYKMSLYGSFDFSVYVTSGSTSNFLRENALVDNIGTMAIYGTVSSTTSEYNGYIGTVDQTAFELMGLKLEKGSYPQKNTDIALEKELLLRLGIDDSIGSKISLQFQDGANHIETITFTLCGILTPYHNSYLKQGPLVTAFVCDNFSSTRRYPIFNNNFVSLKTDYRSADIMEELHDAVKLTSNTTEEKWNYNTYLKYTESNDQFILFLVLMFSAILSSLIYHNYFTYYINRYRELVKFHIIGLNRQKIYKILSQEATTSIIISILFGVINLLLVCGIMKVAKLINPNIYSLYINWPNLGIMFLLACLTLIISIIISKFHSYMTVTRQPILRLPKPAKYNSNNHSVSHDFIRKRFIAVHRLNIVYYQLLHTIAFASIFIFVILSTYYLDKVKTINNLYLFDYTIGLSPFSDNDSFNLEEVPVSLIENLDKVDDIDMIIPLRYFMDGSTPVIEITEDSTFSYLFSLATNEKIYSDNQLQCILYLPTDNSLYQNSILNSGIKTGDQITLTYSGKALDITVTSIISEETMPNLVPSSINNHPYIFLDNTSYDAITGTTDTTDYNYIEIRYSKTADTDVITNIIDNLCYSEGSQYTLHTIRDRDNAIECVKHQFMLLSYLCSFFILISVTIQRNNYLEWLKSMLPQFRLLWYLGLNKKRMVLAMYWSYINNIVKSLISGSIVTFLVLCIYCLFSSPDPIIKLSIPYLYSSFNVYLYCGIFIISLVIIQLVTTFIPVKKYINKI